MRVRIKFFFPDSSKIYREGREYFISQGDRAEAQLCMGTWQETTTTKKNTKKEREM